MTGDQRSVRGLLIAVLVPVVILAGVLASAVLGHGGSDDPAPARPTAPVTAAATAPPARPAPPPPAAPEPPAAAPPAERPAPAPVVPLAPPVAAPEPGPERVPKPVPEPLLGYVPDGAERVDVGSGAQGAAIFRAPGAASRPGPVVIFLHGWVALDPQRYGPWIGHLVRGGATVIYPAYQTKPAYDTITPLANVLAGVRTALEQVHVAPGRLVVAGHSAGGALAADYAAVATANGLPAPAAVFSVYPGRKLRHLAIPIPTVNLATIAAGTRVLVFAGERDTAVGSATAKQIVSGATHADASLQIVSDDAVDEHSAPRRSDAAAQQTFWQPLDALVAATARNARSGSTTLAWRSAGSAANIRPRVRHLYRLRSRLASQPRQKERRSVDLNDTPEQVQYRAKVRAWLDEHKHEAPAEQGEDDAGYIDARRAWQGKLAAAGLAGVTWPTELGGQGLGPIEHVIVGQEIARAGVPNVLDVIGVGMLGPTIIAHGTEEQKSRYLGPMLHGDEVWCQLFSEPAAGSDLAAVQARAVRQDDGSWRLSGQKVWTTNAHFAAYGLLLARTDADVPKHKGLTMFIVPMDSEGVTIRGLRQISGEAEFNEVFFDDVRLDADAACGPVGGGWGTALTTLMFERLTIGLGSEDLGYRPERYAAAIASDEHARLDPEVRRRLGELCVELLAVKFTGYRMLSLLQQGQIPGPEAGLAKVTTVRSAIEAGDLIADVLGPDALAEDSEWAYMISYLPGLKSAGGTEEILRNTIGERVLGLPPEPRLDKGIPFSELRAKERAGVAS